MTVSLSFSKENESSLELPFVTLAHVTDDITLAVTLYSLVLKVTLSLPGGAVGNAVVTSSTAVAIPVVTSSTIAVIPSAVVVGDGAL